MKPRRHALNPNDNKKLIIMGAAGRDFHDFQVYWKHRKDVEVVCFTATQIPDIDSRTFPAELAGEKYPRGIPIKSQDSLPTLIKTHGVSHCVLAYSDLSYEYVMSLGAQVNTCGANMVMLSPVHTELKSTIPVIAVCAVRTGCGKSQTSRWICNYLREKNLRVAVVRHPMPYGPNLLDQRVQRFSTLQDLVKHKCTIEEMEEYEPHIKGGNILFSGCDYEAILNKAEKEADIIVWDGGNNDGPFFKPDLLITITDPFRVGPESVQYYPGEINVRRADLLVVNKTNSVPLSVVEKLEATLQRLNRRAPIARCASPLTPFLDGQELSHKEARHRLISRRVLVIEDGPTVTHGGLNLGAATLQAEKYRCRIVDPRPFAVGKLKDTFQKYPHLTRVLPAMGYGDEMISDLQTTVNNAAASVDFIIVGTPIDLARLIKLPKPYIKVEYSLSPWNPAQLTDPIDNLLHKMRLAPKSTL